MDVPRLINISSLSLFLHFSFLVVVVNITMKIVALFLLCNVFNSSTTLASHILSVHNGTIGMDSIKLGCVSTLHRRCVTQHIECFLPKSVMQQSGGLVYDHIKTLLAIRALFE